MGLQGSFKFNEYQSKRLVQQENMNLTVIIPMTNKTQRTEFRF